MYKKILHILLAVIILSGIISIPARADDINQETTGQSLENDDNGIALQTVTSGNAYGNAKWYYDDSTCTLEIIGSSEMDEIEYMRDWNAFIKNVKVIYIESCTVNDQMFYGHTLSSLQTVKLLSAKLNDYAFKNFTYLKNLEICGSCDIGNYAFSGCTGLTAASFRLEDVVGQTSLSAYMFNGCTSLQTVNLPETLTSIGKNAFYGCSSLKNITIPTGVTSIGTSAFQGCAALKSITIPAGVSTIEASTFQGCSLLASVTMTSGITTIGKNAFDQCAALGNISIPASVTSIGSYAFSGCASLTSVTIPSKVTKIDEKTFYQCTKLKNVTIPAGVTSIGSYAFSGCTSLTSVTLPSGIDTVSSSAFSKCTGIKTVTIPEGITTFATTAFSDCSGITDIYYSGSVTQFDLFNRNNSIFSSACTLHAAVITDLGTCTVTPQYTSTAYNATEKCPTVTVKDSYGTLNSNRYKVTYTDNFYAGTATITITPNCDGYTGKTTITFTITGTPITTTSGTCGANAAWNFDLATRVLTISGTGMISHCDDWNGFYTAIKKVVIEEGITGIDNYAFSGSEMASSGGKNSGDYPQFSEVSLPSTLREIEDMAFLGNSRLTSVTIPKGVTLLSSYAFAWCTSLTTVYFGPTDSSKVAMGSFVFGYYVGEGTTGWEDTALKDLWFNGTSDQFDDFGIGTPATCNMHYNLSGYDAYICGNYNYTGKPVKAAFTVSDGNEELTENKDYKVTYSNNTKAGTAKATFTGIGNYSGSFSTTFTIEKAESAMKARLSSSTIYSGRTGKIIVSGNAGTVSYKAGKSSVARTSICTLSRSGKITVGAIKAKSGEDTCTITVRDPGDANHKGKTIKLHLTVSICAAPVVKIKNTAKGPKLTWTKTKGSAEWRVLRYNDSTRKWVTVVKSTKKNSWVDTKTVNGRDYQYRVICINSKMGCKCSKLSLSEWIKVKK